MERAIDFGSLLASAAMVPWNRVSTIASTASCEDLRQRVAETHSRFPVLDADGGVFGVVHAKDLLDVDDDALDTTPVAALTRPPLVVPEAATLRTVLAELRREGTEMAIVADEHGAPAGVITLEDIVEELVGDISDEYDPTLPEAEDLGDGSWIVPGRLRLDEIERTTGDRAARGRGLRHRGRAGDVAAPAAGPGRRSGRGRRCRHRGAGPGGLGHHIGPSDPAPRRRRRPRRRAPRGGSAHGASTPDSKVSR